MPTPDHSAPVCPQPTTTMGTFLPWVFSVWLESWSGWLSESESLHRRRPHSPGGEQFVLTFDEASDHYCFVDRAGAMTRKLLRIPQSMLVKLNTTVWGNPVDVCQLHTLKPRTPSWTIPQRPLVSNAGTIQKTAAQGMRYRDDVMEVLSSKKSVSFHTLDKARG